MATCRRWYNCILQFTHANWKTLQLDTQGISQCEERNLEKHVNHILFEGVSGDLLSEIMKKLLDSRCDEIESSDKIL